MDRPVQRSQLAQKAGMAQHHVVPVVIADFARDARRFLVTVSIILSVSGLVVRRITGYLIKYESLYNIRSHN